MANLLRTTSTAWMNAAGSAVLPGNTLIATGRPSGSVSSPYSICSRPFFPSREYPRAASWQCVPSTQEEDRSNMAMAPSRRCRRARAVSMGSWRPSSQSIAAYTSSRGASAMPRSGPRVTSSHHARVASFGFGATTRETIRA